ncbi:RpnC/YadD family protein [Kyrpidia tusciae]|uniref:Transposase YhgA family protein n=1 Tax=Kyrpidia tusciae (strain DSM 2912 / NBRC 15312 / T2) TaxID=562970 RepID=D5WT29_KYRT2|nr:transposase [Kyrpidia tusciae]ADG05133.1 putative transposase YhgA family protein [Kyrpidia tusciae DSM 2912]
MEISRNSNDIVARHLTVAMAQGALAAIGISDAVVVGALPADLPRVEVREDRMDILLELQDGRLMHLEYQKKKEPNLYRFLHYDAAIVERYRCKVRTIVVYTDEVASAPEQLDAGAISYRVENLYLSRIDGDATIDTLRQHVSVGEWTAVDRVKTAFAFHMRFTRRTPEQAFDEIVEVIRRIPDQEEQRYVAALILGFSAKALTDQQMKILREVAGVADLLYSVQREAIEKGWKEGLQKGLQEGLRQGREEEKRDIAKRMLQRGVSVSVVAEFTGLTESEVKQIMRSLDR